jgi:hypothetical protein
MPVILVSTEGPLFQQEISESSIKHLKVAAGMLEDLKTDAEAHIPVQGADALTVQMLCALLERHKDDPVVPDDWQKLPDRVQPSQADREAFKSVPGIQISNLFKATNFVQSQLLMNIVACFLGEIITGTDEKGVQDYFGTPYTVTPEQEKEIDEKYPITFY